MLIKRVPHFALIACFATFSLAAQGAEESALIPADIPLKEDKWLFSIDGAVSFIDTVPRRRKSNGKLTGSSDIVSTTRYFICPTSKAQVFISDGKAVLHACAVQKGKYLCVERDGTHGPKVQFKTAYVYDRKGCRQSLAGGPRRIKGKWQTIATGELIVTSVPYRATVASLKEERLSRHKHVEALRKEIGELAARIKKLENP